MSNILLSNVQYLSVFFEGMVYCSRKIYFYSLNLHNNMGQLNHFFLRYSFHMSRESNVLIVVRLEYTGAWYHEFVVHLNNDNYAVPFCNGM